MITENILSYYSQPGLMSDPGSNLPLFAQLPDGLPELVQAVQGLLVHIFWAERYELKLSEERQAEVQIRSVRGKLARILAINAAPLNEPRLLEQRLVGNCRDFSLLASAMLRAKGIPARARCGFGTYFMPDHYEDHWVCEYWNREDQRWVMFDAQLDAFQQQVLGIQFNTLDMPAGQFVTGGRAWQLCRQNQADPDQFGIFEWHGWDFIKGDLMRDLLALNKFEVLPWDSWGLVETPVAELTQEQMDLVDHAADLTLQGNEAFPAVQALYEENVCFQAPFSWAQ